MKNWSIKENQGKMAPGPEKNIFQQETVWEADCKKMENRCGQKKGVAEGTSEGTASRTTSSPPWERGGGGGRTPSHPLGRMRLGSGGLGQTALKTQEFRMDET